MLLIPNTTVNCATNLIDLHGVRLYIQKTSCMNDLHVLCTVYIICTTCVSMSRIASETANEIAHMAVN